MNAVVDEARENVAEFRAPGPGERLRAARLSAGLEPSAVANRLHLDVGMIELLESDQYDRLPERVFVQGYVRNYARLVGLPPESVLKQLDERCPGGEERKFENIGRQAGAEMRSGALLVRLVTLGVVLGTAALFFTWWKGPLTWLENTEPQAQKAVETNIPPAAEADGTLRIPQLQPSPGAPGGVQAEQPSSGAAPVKPADGSTMSSKTTSAPTKVSAMTVPLPATTGVQRLGRTATPRVNDAAAVAPVAVRQTTVVPAVANERRIVVEFFEPCWVDVRDATREFKLFGEMPKGARKVLGGEPPYQVVIGKTSAVRLTVDGVFFDIGRYARGNVARFTLDPNSMN